VKKALLHFLLLAACFLGCWYLLASLKLTQVFRVEELSRENEHRIGTYVAEAFTRGVDELGADSARALTAALERRICEANGIADSGITLHVVANGDVNAFSLPDRHLVVNTGLILYCASADELAGVIAHELAHMEHRHVMKKMVKEIGLGMLATIAGGKSTGEILRQTAKTLSSTAFDREQESDADSASVRYLQAARIDAEGLANFLFRLAGEKNDVAKSFEWISTHPNSNDRAAAILKLTNERSAASAPAASDSAWKAYQRVIREAVKE
jgi:predicted Zn-dependent protease